MTARKAKTAATRARPKAKAAGVAAKLPKPSPRQLEAARRKFEEGLVKRGEAVPEGEPLPAGGTHVIVGRDAAGRPIVKRKRFSVR